MKSTLTYLLGAWLVLALTGADAKAQDPDNYGPILFMIIDKDLEKALNKAEKYTNRNKTKRHPEPYILASMAYYEISKDESMREDYPRAFRNAIKNAYKGARYDKENEYLPEYSQYITELKVEIMKEARFYYDEGTWRKSVSYAKYVTRIDPDDLGALLLKGVGEIKSRNEFQAEKTLEEAAEIAKSSSPSSFNSELLPFLRFGIMEYAEIMKERGEKDKAKPVLALGEQTFEEDTEFRNFIASY